MKKIFNILLLITTILSCNANESKSYDYTIGITQIVSHQALDDAKNGFKDYLKEQGLNIRYIENNANGDISVANLNAKNLVNNNIDLIYAIATPTAQAASNATTTIPIVFSAVTDDKSSNLINDNVTGVLDFLDPKLQIKELLKIKPDVKTIGFIYNSSEQNSVFQLEAIKNAAREFNISIIDKGVTQVNEIPQAIDVLSSEVDVIYTPADNLVASSINLIAEKALNNKKITMGAEKAHVDKGILLSMGINYYDLGKMAGKIAYDILKEGKKPNDIPSQKVDKLNLDINENTKKELGLEF